MSPGSRKPSEIIEVFGERSEERPFFQKRSTRISSLELKGGLACLRRFIAER